LRCVEECVYLNWSNGELGDEPRALAILPFTRQWLHELGLAVNEVVPELWFICSKGDPEDSIME
jgi:hypothetical protein